MVAEAYLQLGSRKPHLRGSTLRPSAEGGAEIDAAAVSTGVKQMPEDQAGALSFSPSPLPRKLDQCKCTSGGRTGWQLDMEQLQAPAVVLPLPIFNKLIRLETI